MAKPATVITRILKRDNFNKVDLESGVDSSQYLFGHGLLLFAVKRVSEHESLHLQSSGFVFAQQSHVIERLALRTQVPQAELQARLLRMQIYASHEKLLEPGTHMVLFILRPTLDRGFDVLVQSDARNLLPSAHLTDQHHLASALLLQQLEGSTMFGCQDRLQRRYCSGQHQDIARSMIEGIRELSTSLPADLLSDCRLAGIPLLGPSAAPTGEKIEIIAFRAILDPHKVHKPIPRYEFMPLKFFITRQHSYTDSADLSAFGHKMRHEFAHLSDQPGHIEKHSFTSSLGRKTASMQTMRSHPEACIGEFADQPGIYRPGSFDINTDKCGIRSDK